MFGKVDQQLLARIAINKENFQVMKERDIYKLREDHRSLMFCDETDRKSLNIHKKTHFKSGSSILLQESQNYYASIQNKEECMNDLSMLIDR